MPRNVNKKADGWALRMVCRSIVMHHSQIWQVHIVHSTYMHAVKFRVKFELSHRMRASAIGRSMSDPLSVITFACADAYWIQIRSLRGLCMLMLHHDTSRIIIEGISDSICNIIVCMYRLLPSWYHAIYCIHSGGHGLLVPEGRGFESQCRQVLIFGFPNGYLLWWGVNSRVHAARAAAV